MTNWTQGFITIGKYQFINWFPDWRGINFFRWDKDKSDD